MQTELGRGALELCSPSNQTETVEHTKAAYCAQAPNIIFIVDIHGHLYTCVPSSTTL